MKLTEASARQITKIALEIQKVADEMKKHAGFFKAAKDEAEKKKHVEHLKRLTAQKKKLEAEMDKAVSGLDRYADLVDESTLKEALKPLIKQALKEWSIPAYKFTPALKTELPEALAYHGDHNMLVGRGHTVTVWYCPMERSAYLDMPNAKNFYEIMAENEAEAMAVLQAYDRARADSDQDVNNSVLKKPNKLRESKLSEDISVIMNSLKPFIKKGLKIQKSGNKITKLEIPTNLDDRTLDKFEEELYLWNINPKVVYSYDISNPGKSFRYKFNESKLQEKAESQAQQQAAGIALAAKRGEVPMSDLKGASKEMAKMSEKDLEDFASTSHKGLPDKVDEASMENSTKKLVSESDKDSYGEVPNDILNDMKEAYYGIADHIRDLGRSIQIASQNTTKMAAFKNDWKAWRDLKKAFDKLTMGKYL